LNNTLAASGSLAVVTMALAHVSAASKTTTTLSRPVVFSGRPAVSSQLTFAEIARAVH
jgi:hypothetical protein